MLQIQHISKQYRTGELIQRALDDVSLNLRDSEFVAILGPSGSGKTTLLNIIGGLDRYDDGNLIINGVSTREYNDRDWDTYRNHSIGFVFQSYNLIPHQTILSNVELALTIAGLSAKERKARARKALTEVGLADHVNKKPNQLSGGQMQRVALARALVNDPDILLADEPTGALDTETSIQVMNLMKEVAKDRLVVMVTHNPELAEEYASRIVRLKDGKITDDSMPYTDADIAADISVPVGAAAGAALAAESAEAGAETAGAQAADAKAAGAKKEKGSRKSSMSFLTSLALSFSNLRTKKGRTILTSFAGSIGIIGIALILSLSTGVNQYIDKIQRDTMASYPITINSTSLDFASLMGNGAEAQEGEETEEEEERDPDKVYVSYWDIEASSAVTTGIKENNLTAFKKYLDDPSSEIHKYIGENGIVYNYNVDFKAYSYDADHKLVDTDVDVTSEFEDQDNVLGNLMQARTLMMSNMSTMFGGGESSNAANFSEMMAGANGDTVSALVKDNYDVVYGNWPDSYDEVVLVLNRNGSLSSGVMYQLGLITKEQYRNAVRKVEKDETPDEMSFRFQDICDHEFYLVTASDLYKKNKSGTFSAIPAEDEELEKAVERGIKLRIVGIVKAAEDSDIQSLDTSVCYTTLLTDHIIDRGNNSEVIQAQKAAPETDVLSGQPFTTDEPDDKTKAKKARTYLRGLSREEKEQSISTLMMIDYEGVMKALITTQMSELSEKIAPVIQQKLGAAIQSAMQSAMTQMMSSLQGQIQKAMEEVMQQAMQNVMKQVMDQVMPKIMEQVMPKVMEEVMPKVMDKVMKEAASQFQEEILPDLMEDLAKQVLEQGVLNNLQNILKLIQEQLPDALPQEILDLENAATLEELVEALGKIDFSTLDLSGIDFSSLDFSDFSFEEIDLSKLDYSKIDFSKLDFSKIDLSDIDLKGLDLKDLDLSGIDLKNIDLSGLDLSKLNLSGLDLSGLDFSGMDLSGLSSAFEDMSFSTSEGDMTEVVRYWLENIATRSSLTKVYDRMIGVSSYDGNMKKFGLINYDAPAMISLYADTFEGKDGISDSIKTYNDGAEEENKITYTDYVALITTSITTIIDAISYVLIGFVGVSLFVSCIMIGIITHISVLERTKEIGVLRALGASKRNISNVFNAETFIIGCLSGIIGVGITLLLIIPINAIVHSLMDSTVLSATLPPVSAGILILISIVITMIGGLIPANKAAKQDPVVALRTE